MKRICPTCFTELPEEANYCSTCGKCMREVEEYTIQYTGATPQTKEVSILWHNGLYGPFKYEIQGKETPLYMLLHFADLWASRVTEEGNDGAE